MVSKTTASTVRLQDFNVVLRLVNPALKHTVITYRPKLRIKGAKRHTKVANGFLKPPETFLRFKSMDNLVKKSTTALLVKVKFDFTRINPNFQLTSKCVGTMLSLNLVGRTNAFIVSTSPTFTH